MADPVLSTHEALAAARKRSVIAVIANAATAPVLGMHLASVEANAPHLLSLYIVVALDLQTQQACQHWGKERRHNIVCSLEDAHKVLPSGANASETFPSWAQRD